MRHRQMFMAAGVAVIGGFTAIATAQNPGSPDSHRAAAERAAGSDYSSILRTLCVEMAEPGYSARTASAPARTAQAPPSRTSWHADPVKVFDNLYWLGQSEYSAWAVVTSDGIIIVDTLFDYSVEDEIVTGLKTMGLDPAKIKYAIASHGHNDHVGGAKFLQEKFGARIVLSAADWDLLEKNPLIPKPKRDIVATDGMKLTLGDTTLTLYLTPGHTPGTISTIIPVKDRGTSHVAAYSGGTGFNFTITPDRNREYWFRTYLASNEKFRNIARQAGADVILTNHPTLDASRSKLPRVLARKPGEPHPFVVGAESVNRYLTVASECANASLATMRR